MPKPRVKELQEKIAVLEGVVHNSESIIRKKTDSLDELQKENEELRTKLRSMTGAMMLMATNFPAAQDW